MTKEVEIEEQIAELKELIKNRDEISTEEVRGLVTEITIRPNEIQADNVVVTTTGKMWL
jgi:nucleotide-binding universal stress UspA family protein